MSPTEPRFELDASSSTPSSCRPSPTSFSRLSPRAAKLVLATIVLGAIACVTLSSSAWSRGRTGRAPRPNNDITLYRAEIDRVAAGEEYYDVAGEELRQRGYPTKSVFNWRTPILAWVLAYLPDPALGKVTIIAVSIFAILLTFGAVARDGGVRQASLGAVLTFGALMLGMLGDSHVMPVVWAGALVAASLAAYGIGRRWLAVVLGIAALFLRELAGPYCALALLVAAQERRWREVGGWVVGLALYAAFYAFHISAVHAHQTAADISHPGTWLQGGGLAFVISLAQIHGYLIVLPQWVAAIYFALAMVGAASAATPWSRRAALSLALYVALFGVVGYEFNQYWGVVIAPLFAIAAARAPAAIRDLARAAFAGSAARAAYAVR